MITLTIVVTAALAIGLFWIELGIGLVCSLFVLIGKLLEKLFTTWWGWLLIFIGIAIALCI